MLHNLITPESNNLFTLFGQWTNYVVAGGYLRDKWFGKPIKDIDIFYWGDLPSNVIQVSNAVSFNTTEYPNINTICTHKGNVNGIPIDFIKIINPGWTPVELIKSFPCSLSQIFQYGGNCNSVMTSAWFEKSRKALTLYFHDNCSDNYFDKITDKYDWPKVFIDEELTVAQFENSQNSWGGIDNVFISSTIQPTKKLKVKPPQIKYKVINTTKPNCYKENVDW